MCATREEGGIIVLNNNCKKFRLDVTALQERKHRGNDIPELEHYRATGIDFQAISG